MTDDNSVEHSKATHLVGIGASAGGLEALERLFRSMPTDTGMAFVVIQHLSPDFRSLMDELIARFTKMPVSLIVDITPIEPNMIYLLPPRKDAFVQGNNLIAKDRSPGKQLSMPINIFFNSLAEVWKNRAIGVVLSGTGSDGSDGVISISNAGGFTLVQEPDTAKFDGMPVSAISTGYVDKVVSAEGIPEAMLSLVRDLKMTGDPAFQEDISADELVNQPGVSDIYEALNEQFALDFKLYKPSTILRRIQRRASFGQHQMNLDEYANKVKTVDDELYALYRDLLIGVTGFFRDRDAFEALRKQVLSEDIEKFPEGQDYRVWVCGCSTGEEAYSIAMMILEEFERLGRPPCLKVFATDVNREYLGIASEGVYSAQQIEQVPDEYREKYFMPTGSGSFKVSPSLRKAIIFSEHNLLKNPPFTRMNLVSSRNLLIYLKANAQAPAVTSFNFSLVSGGVLFTGSSETLGAFSSDFEAIDRHWKIYRKVRESSLTLPARTNEHVGQLVSNDYTMQKTEAKNYLVRLYQSLLDKYIPYGFLINESNEVLEVFGMDKRGWRPGSKATVDEIYTALDPSLAKQIEQEMKSLSVGKKSATEPIERVVELSSEQAKVELQIEHIVDKLSGLKCFMVVIKPMQNEAKASLQESDNSQIRNFSLPADSLAFVTSLQNELQSAKEALQTNAEELETSNEELQASNEELQASNEELQSTNEELHSVNEELYTVNTELELKIVELDKTSSDLRNLVDSTQIASVFLDMSYAIRVYTPLIQDVFALMPNDVGRDLRDFTPKVIDPNLLGDIAEAYKSGNMSERIVYSKASPGRVYLRRASGYRDAKGKIDGVLLTFVDMSHIRKTGVPLMMQGIKRILGLQDKA
ncbi:MAG: chemotaxis protein CheB [Limnobacter sp.]|nr:chemotaxis protein CheB [Limnobacter sp.]